MRWLSLLVLLSCLIPVAAQAPATQPPAAKPAQAKPPARPKPTVENYKYGTESERQVFDFWKAESKTPTPLVLLIHGGGWVNGDKTSYGNSVIKPLLDAGISVAAINYRFIAQAMEQKVEPPVKACVMDAGRALQTLRSKATEWNIDVKKVGATGGSAGACTSLWLALHDDLADAKSEDPIKKQSTKLQAVAVTGPQTSLDPKELREWMPNAVYAGHAFGFAEKGRSRAQEFELALQNRDKIMPWIKEYSPIELVTKDDPPIYMEFPKQDKPPVVGEKQTDATHSALYGVKLAEKLQAAGIENVVTYPGKKDETYGSMVKFLIAKLKK